MYCFPLWSCIFWMVSRFGGHLRFLRPVLGATSGILCTVLNALTVVFCTVQNAFLEYCARVSGHMRCAVSSLESLFEQSVHSDGQMSNSAAGSDGQILYQDLEASSPDCPGRLEIVRRWATKMVNGRNHKCNWGRLNKLNMYTGRTMEKVNLHTGAEVEEAHPTPREEVESIGSKHTPA